MTEYVTIQTTDGPVRFPKGMSRAEMAAALNAKSAKAPDTSFMGRLKDNVIGVNDGIDSPGEKLGSFIRGTAAGAARGLADVPAIPANLAQLGVAGYEKLTGAEQPTAASRALDALPDTRDLLAKVPVIGPESEYVAPGRAGKFASTIGEFSGAAGGAARVLGGAADLSGVLRYGAIPGAASEAAGQATEGTSVEPYARIAAALGASVLAGKPTGKAAPNRADPQDAEMARILQSKGVKPTVGQITRSPLMRRLEGSQDVLPSQADDFTKAALSTTGSKATRAVPQALKEASDDIVQAMDDAVAGVTIRPTSQMAQKVDDVLMEYFENTPKASVVPKVKNIADEIIDAATSPRAAPLGLDTLKAWRSRLGALLNSKDAEVRNAAWGIRGVIDDATEEALKAAGRADDVTKLQTAREQYRNWLAVADASTRAGAEGGQLSATQLQQSVIRSQGRRNAAVGNTTELGELSRAGAGLLRPEPTVSAGGVRSISQQLGGGIAGGAIGSQLMPGNPIAGALIGAGAGGLSMDIGQALMRSPSVQSTMLDPFGKIMQALRRTSPAIVAQSGN